MAEISLARPARESPEELVKCFRHEGEECPRCDGSGYRPRRYCAGCGEPSGKPSEGGRGLMGLKNRRDKDQPMWCLHCHPEHHFIDAVWSFWTGWVDSGAALFPLWVLWQHLRR
jgi:hypothetical protein